MSATVLDTHAHSDSQRVLRQRESERAQDEPVYEIGFAPIPSSLDEQTHNRHETSLANYKRDPERALAAVKVGAVTPPAINVTIFDKSLAGGSYTRPWLSSIHENATDVEDDQGKKKASSRHLLSGGWNSSPPLRSSLLGPLRRLFRLVRRNSRIRLVFVLFAVLFIWVTYVAPSPSATKAPEVADAATIPRAGPSQRRMFDTIHLRRLRSPSHVSPPKDVSHSVNARGLLVVNPSSQIHPVAQLMEEAAKEWDAKVARQSKTLKEAVEEYGRRNGRAPPKGFDKWWKYVCDNNVQLPDEYDQIHRDLLLFRALSPHELRNQVAIARKLPMTYSISVRNGHIDTSLNFDPTKIHNTQVRIDQQVGLIKDIAKDLPDFDAVYSIDDVPTQFIEYNHRLEMIDHIDSQEGYFETRAEWDFSYRGWQAGCSSSSPLGEVSNQGRYKRGKPQDPKTFRPAPFTTALESKSFIKDHRATMDPCLHPDLIPIHSAFASKSPVVGPLIPVFSLSKTTMHADILGVPTEQVEVNGELIPWEQRTQDALLWRGRTTGPWHKRKNDWRSTQRTRLVKIGNGRGWTRTHKDEDDSVVHMLPPSSVVGRSTLDQSAVAEEWEKVNSHYMDVAYTGSVIQCDKADGSCKALADGYKYRDRMGVKEAAQYKYVIDVDGNAWSARFQRLISSGSVVFKSTVFPEWWTERIQPWLHYVPTKVDYSDLYDSLAYFRGDLAGRDGHEEEAKAMASRALEWSNTHMRPEDMTAYMFRLNLEWGRLVSTDREAASLVYSPEMEVTRSG